MKYADVRTEYLVFKEGKDILALSCGELIFYHNNNEIKRWRDNENIYPLTIDLLNERNEKKKEKLKERIYNSATYLTFKLLCKEQA